ncbi:MAG TPA: hypothetical protein G4O15_06110 [Dehalococcoidia bacterium]|nr:hypothetical protein [Dehalococcoidia bacterium]
MESRYDEITRFMNEYVKAYSEYGQIAESHSVMDKFYAPELSFDDMVTSREQWYETCLSHNHVQDKLTLEHLFIDEKQNEVGALLTAQAIERATGKVLLEIKMNTLYNLKTDENGEFKIIKARVFLETNPQKVAKLCQIYGMDFNNVE